MQTNDKSSIIFLFLLICLYPVRCWAQSEKKQDNQIPVLDKTKSYPSKKIEFDTEVTYVPLETSSDVLLGEQCRLRYVSDKKILFSDEYRGDVFIFDLLGNLYSSFNQKNGLGYTAITFVAYDELQEEVFILDYYKRKVFVFSEEGTLLRSFKTPPETYIAEIYNFDESTLLAFDENSFGSDDAIKPYLYLAKDDGKIKGYVAIDVKEVNPRQVTEKTKNNASSGYSFVHINPDNCKFGNDFILSNRSMDTVYLLKQDKSLTPLFTQNPSVHSDHPTASSVGMITNQFLRICVSSQDLKEVVKIMKAGGNWNPKFKHFILDRNTGEFFKDADEGDFSVHKVDTPGEQSYDLMQAFNLINANNMGLLKGELKEIASKLDIGDNPVLKIEKIK